MPALIIGTEPVDDHQAALLADEFLARLVFDHSAWRAWRRRGVAVGLISPGYLASAADAALCLPGNGKRAEKFTSSSRPSEPD
jgi:hypothetical protein